VGFGLLIAAGGLLVWWGVPLGRLPGDIVVRRGSFSFYLPITTSIIVSVALTVLMALFKR
jgi:membrane protein implicated in regulation of membrane protease activity